MSLLMWLAVSCNRQIDNSKVIVDISSSAESTVFDSIIYPNVKYELGNKAYSDLFRDMIIKEGTKESEDFFNRIMECRTLFENNEGNKSFTKALQLLAELLENNKADDSVVSELLLAESLYQASRSFYYERNEVLNPTSTLLENGISISKKYISSKNPLIQQVALFQLARLFDVMQGLTQQYSAYIEPLSPDQLLFASGNALHIKHTLLGLKGGPVLRSYSNQFIDNSQLCDRGYLNICNTVMAELLISAFKEFPYLNAKDRNEYGEFINVISYELAHYYLENQKFKLAKGIIERDIALKMNIENYCLGDSLLPFDLKEGVEHHSALLIIALTEYIETSGETEYKNVLKQISTQLENKSIEIFSEAETANSQSFNQMGQIAFYSGNMLLQDVGGFKTEQEKFKYLQSLYKMYSLQEYEFLAKTELLHTNLEYEKLFTEVYESENKLRNAEIKLNTNLEQQNVIECSDYFVEYKQNQKLVNSTIIEDMLSINLLDLKAIRTKLNENESWITFFKQGRQSESIIGFVISKADVRIKIINLEDKITHDSLTVNMILNRLEKTIISNLKWTGNETNLVSILANYCFENFISPNAEHIIISNLGFPSSRIWEVVIQDFDLQHQGSIKSIRYDDRYIFNFKKPEEKITSNWLAMAPQFNPEDFSLAENDRADLMSRLRGADLVKYNPWFNLNPNRKYSPLIYNVEEVVEVNKSLNGIIYIGSEANKQTFSNLQTENSVIHIASHAFLDENDLYRSGIVLGNDPATSDTSAFENILFAYEIRTMKLDAELVVLSACETGISPMRQGGVDWSLGRAFIEAGCRNTVTSLWNVDDKSTHDIIIDFYKELKNGTGKAEALYTAKTKYIKKHPGENPHYWTPLILSGDNKPIYFE